MYTLFRSIIGWPMTRRDVNTNFPLDCDVLMFHNAEKRREMVIFQVYDYLTIWIDDVPMKNRIPMELWRDFFRRGPVHRRHHHHYHHHHHHHLSLSFFLSLSLSLSCFHSDDANWQAIVRITISSVKQVNSVRYILSFV